MQESCKLDVAGVLLLPRTMDADALACERVFCQLGSHIVRRELCSACGDCRYSPSTGYGTVLGDYTQIAKTIKLNLSVQCAEKKKKEHSRTSVNSQVQPPKENPFIEAPVVC